jgi:thiosulfate reductase cytochrome b subunit
MRRLRWLIPVAVVVVLVVVFGARSLRELAGVQNFLATYPGESALPAGAPVGLPAWLGWQHFLSAFLMVLIVRSGLLIRTTKRPTAFWTRTVGPQTGRPRTRISLDTWFHLSLDVLWIANGILFIVLIFATGHWVRLVPTSWEIVPNAISAGLQYASLDWPTENGWVNYNSLQQLAYFATVFIAAPLAIVTGVRMSPLWPQKAGRLTKAYPIEWARALHFPVMLYFVLFTIVHVTLVLATGALRNLNHIYVATDDTGSWVGFVLFVVSLVGMAAAVILLRPVILRPIAALTGKISR